MGGDMKPKLLVIGGLLALAIAGVGVVLFAGKGNAGGPEEAGSKRVASQQTTAAPAVPPQVLQAPPPPPTVAPLAEPVPTPTDPFAGGPKPPVRHTTTTTTRVDAPPPPPDQIAVVELPTTVLTSNYGGTVSGDLGALGPKPTTPVLPLEPAPPTHDPMEMPIALRGTTSPVARRASPGFEGYRAQVYAVQGQPMALVSAGGADTITLGIGSTWGQYRVRTITADLVVFADAYGRAYYLPAVSHRGGGGV